MVAIPEASAVSISLWFSAIHPVLNLVAWVVFLELEVPFKLLNGCVTQPVGLASTSE